MPRRVIHSLKGHFGPPKEEFNSDEIDPPPDYDSKDILHILDRIRYNNITTSTTSEIPEQIIHVGQQELQLQLHGPTSNGIENNIKMSNAVAVQQAQNPPSSLSQQQASTFSMTSGATINTVEQNKLFMEEIVHSTVVYVWFLILLSLVGFVIFNYMWNREKKKKKKSLVSRKSSSPV